MTELEEVKTLDVASYGQSVAIIGGGLAGMAAALAARQEGLHVELFEQGNRLGGRVCSLEESWNGQIIDHCQHVAMGCCTNFLDFCRRTGVMDCFEKYDTIYFIGPDGRQSDITPVRWLPAPLHLLPGLLRLKFLSRRERWSIVRTIRKLVRLRISKENDDESIGAWLIRQGQSQSARDGFWSAVLVSALSETLDHASLQAAKKVFWDGFCASRGACELYMPKVPLRVVFNGRVSDRLEREGVCIHRGVGVKQIASDGRGGWDLSLYDGYTRKFLAVIIAVPWYCVERLIFLSTTRLQWHEVIEKFQPSAISAIHLWFDRAITPLPHAVLAGRLSQWVFNMSSLTKAARSSLNGHSSGKICSGQDNAFYYQVVISAAHRFVKNGKDELLSAVVNDLQAVFPEARKANLLHSQIVTRPKAVFSMQPGLDRFRPAQDTKAPGLFLAGDWTDTGWPATMEGAVRSGYLAMEELLKFLGRPKKILADDLA